MKATVDLRCYLSQVAHLLENLEVEDMALLDNLRTKVHKAIEHTLKDENIEALEILDEIETPINMLVAKLEMEKTRPDLEILPISSKRPIHN